LKRYGVQLSSVRLVPIARRELETEAVSRKPGKHVKVDVKDLLPCRLTVRKEEIDPLTPQTARPQSRGYFLRYTEHFGAGSLFEVGQAGRVGVWDHENVTGVYRLDIHKSRASLVPINDAARKLTG